MSESSHRSALAPGLIYILVLTAVLAVVLVVRPFQWMNDDAYFYLKVALNHSRGLGSSFSGLAPTNGYHPLWQWLLFGLFDLAMPTVISGLVLSRLLSLAFMAAALHLLHRFARQAFGVWWAGATVAVLSIMATRGVYCVEFWLYAAAIGGLLCFGLRCTASVLDGLLAGLLGSIAILARLDGVVLVGCWIAAISIHFWRRPDHRGAMRFAATSIGIMAIAVGLYAYGNHRSFGHAATISAMLKSTFPWPRLSAGTLSLPTKYAWPGVLSGLAFLFWFFRTRPRDRSMNLLAVVGFAAVLHLLLVHLFTRWPAFGIWWWTPSYFALALGVGFAGFRFVGQRWATAIVIGAAAWNALAIADALIRYPDRPEGVTGSQYAAHLPKDAVIFQVDATGMTSYLADRTVINGDGLMNTLEYQEALANGKLLDYLAQFGVTHIVHDEAEVISPEVLSGQYTHARLAVPCHLYGRATTLDLPREWETGRWTVDWPGQWFPWPRHTHAQTFVVWRLPSERRQWRRMILETTRPG